MRAPLILCILLILSSCFFVPAEGQTCFGEACNLPRLPSLPNLGIFRPVEPVKLTPPRCLVRVGNQVAGSLSWGSGVIVDRGDGVAGVLTVWHLFRDGVGSIGVNTPTQSLSGRLLDQDPIWDLALIEVAGLTLADAVPIALEAPRVGDTVFSWGYGQDARAACNAGRVKSYAGAMGASTFETLQLSGSARQGDSGGPVLDASGRLVGIIWGTDGRVVTASYCGRIAKFLRSAVLPAIPKTPAGGGGVDRRPSLQNDADVAGPADAQAELIALRARVAALLYAARERDKPRPNEDIPDKAPAGPVDATPPGPEMGGGHERRGPVAETQPGPARQRAGRGVGEVASAAAPWLLLLLGASGVGLPAGAWWVVRGWLAARRYRRRDDVAIDWLEPATKKPAAEPVKADGGPAEKAEPFFGLQRDDREAKELIRLSAAEGRSPVFDALIGRLALARLDEWADDSQPDGFKKDFATVMRGDLLKRFNDIAPPAVVPNKE